MLPKLLCGVFGWKEIAEFLKKIGKILVGGVQMS